MVADITSKMKGIDAADVAGKRVLVRADLNVPLSDGRVTDLFRLEKLMPTIRVLTGRGAKVVLISHLGRPKGRLTPDLSLQPVAQKLASLLNGAGVRFIEDCVGPAARTGVAALKNGEVALLENLRFHPAEEKNDLAFAAALGALGDLYVNDAFSVSHRAHASTDAITSLLPAYAGPQMLSELRALAMALDIPQRPVAAIIGGAKVSTKSPVLTNLTAKVDVLVIGGGMANTFLHAEGTGVGKSLYEPDSLPVVEEIMSRAAENGCQIILPVDVVGALALKTGAASAVYEVGGLPPDRMILDLGPRSLAALEERMLEWKTLLWNGPVGAFEIAPFGEGTFALARLAAKLTRAGKLTTVAGGGDTVAALNAAGVINDFTYVSTAGGAFLEWLEGRELPGVAALIRR